MVVGAGIAGLAAAHALQRGGRRVVVLEAERHVGGRMCSLTRHGAVIDTGAQFVSAGYRRMHRLARGLGVEIADLRTTRSAVIADGRVHAMRPHRATEVLSCGVLPAGARLRYALRMARECLPRRGGDDLADYGRWAGRDDTTVREWLRRCGLAPVDRALAAPVLEGLYFQSTARTSRALWLMSSAHAVRGHANRAIVGGMAALPRALARGLDVRLGVRVRRLRAVDGHVAVHCDDGTLLARRVVCAVPAPIARALWPDAPAPAAALLATGYSRGLVLSWCLERTWSPPATLAALYGVLLPRAQAEGLAAIGFESAKHADREGEVVVVQAMLDDAAAGEWMRADDAAIVEAWRPRLARWLGPLRQAEREVRVSRWPLAMPLCPVGRAGDARRYREGAAGSAILLAGDHTGAPWSESALQSGEWAADVILGEG